VNEPLVSHPIGLILGLALVGLLPFAFMALTAFVKISTVLHISRTAIGAQNVPSTTIVMALSAALTVLAMAPVGERIADGIAPLLRGEVTETAQVIETVVASTAEPLRSFLHANASKTERQRFLLLARKTGASGTTIEERDFRVIIPAFMVTELTEAFTLGFAIFLPFLVIDLVVGNVLLALGMQMMNPTQVSLPFKLLLFVSAGGWGLLAQALVSGYQPG
jgi:type III secretion protein R